MKRQLFYLIISFILVQHSVSICYAGRQVNDSINDGPYIFNIKNKLQVLSIENNLLIKDYITPENFPEIKNRFSLMCSYKDLLVNYSKRKNHSQNFDNIDSLGVISDIHGKYDSYLRLLKAMGIIDNNLHWKFGSGHLVVLGDIFDRGDMVTETLWHIFGLERQAVDAGGMVHLLLGNHEVMTLAGNLNSLDMKYKRVEGITGTKYFDLYPGNSVLGNWLRSKPVVITINDIIFIHGGISPELVQKRYSLMKLNMVFSEKIVGKVLRDKDLNKVPPMSDDRNLRIENSTTTNFGKVSSGKIYGNSLDDNNEIKELLFLVGDNGPIWYRGYFTDATFTENDLNSILDYYDKKHVVVGHTTSYDIDSRFNYKVIGVDAGLWSDQAGAMLIYKNGSFYKGYSTGARIKLSNTR
ncbi:MAG: metallophosphoesterase [Bacteroidia bacterium]|nr:metallophosphoesterase [Bacteroidia bacterium]